MDTRIFNNFCILKTATNISRLMLMFKDTIIQLSFQEWTVIIKGLFKDNKQQINVIYFNK